MPAKASRAAFGEALIDLGARDERIVTLVDREEGARENIEGAGQVLRSVFTRTQVVGK